MIERKRRRSTGTFVSVWHTRDVSMEDEPYTLICEGDDPDGDPHGGVISVYTMSEARTWAPFPDAWCPSCQEARP